MALIASPPTTKPSFSPLRRRPNPTPSQYKMSRHCIALFNNTVNCSVFHQESTRLVSVVKPAAVESCFSRILSSKPSFFTPIGRNPNPRSSGDKISRHCDALFYNPLSCSVFGQENTRLPSTVKAAVGETVPMAEEGSFGRILLSDVVVKRKRNVYWGREWNLKDMATLGTIMAMHLLCFFAPFVFNWGAFWVAVGLYVVTGMFGVTLSYHRNLTHRSFKLPKWLEYLFAYCGAQTLQGHPIDWVSTHRYHHQFCDSEKDPHSPFEGFWFSHMSWIFDTNAVEKRCGKPDNAADLEKQPFYRFLRNTYLVHPIALGALLYAIGGFPFIVWGMGVRIVWVYHITWLVNSACHVWGKQAWNTGDLSRNNWWVALLAFGEGWHNNHHAFEYSARHGLEWWQVDMTWYVVKLLEALGLATDVKLPNSVHKKRMAFADNNE